jgi:hypothetical protein
MSGAFNPRYSDREREAVVEAYEDRRIRPARRVAELAAAGELEFDGERLEAFEIPVSTVRSLARDARRRRTGEPPSDLLTESPRDAVEALRRQLINTADEMLKAENRKKPERRDPERVRQIARAAREIASLPGPTDPRPPAPGAKVGGVRDGGQTRGGVAGALLADHRAGGAAPAWPAPPLPAPSVADTLDTPEEAAPDDDGSPAALARELVAQFEAGEEIRRDAASPRNEHAEQDASRDEFDHSRLAAEDVTAIERSERGRY